MTAPLPVVMDKAFGNAGEKRTAGVILSSRSRRRSVLLCLPFFNAFIAVFLVKSFLKVLSIRKVPNSILKKKRATEHNKFKFKRQ